MGMRKTLAKAFLTVDRKANGESTVEWATADGRKFDDATIAAVRESLGAGTGSGTVTDGSITTPKLADGSVTAQKVAADVATQAELNAVVAALPGTYAPLASPAFTGTPTAPTAAVDTATTQVASTAFVVGQAAAATPLVNGTAAAGTSNRFARADHVHGTDTTRAPLASPAFTGTPTAPTAAGGTNTTQLATTAFVAAALGGVVAGAPSVTTVGTAGTAQTLAAPASGESAVYKLTLTSASCALTLSGAQSGKRTVIEVHLTQDGSGSRLVTWPGSVQWSTGRAPVLSLLPNRTDVVQLVSLDAGATWLGGLTGSGFTATSTPGTPTAFTVSAVSNTVLQLDWTAPIGSTPNVTGYKIYRGTVSGSLTLLTTITNVTTYTDTGLTASTKYFYRVAAVNAVGDGTQTAETSATTQATGLPTTGTTATMWFKADAVAGINSGSAVASWVDSTGSGNPAAAVSAQPSFQTNVVNGLPVLRFAGSQKMSTVTGLGSNGSTIFAVVKAASVASTIGFFGGAAGSYEVIVGTDSKLALVKTNVIGMGSSASTIPNVTTAFHVFSITVAAGDGTSSRSVSLTVDGVVTNTTSSAYPTVTLGPTLIGGGNGQTGGENWNGDIAEILYYPAPLNTTDHNAVKSYLATKYGITVS